MVKILFLLKVMSITIICIPHPTVISQSETYGFMRGNLLTIAKLIKEKWEEVCGCIYDLFVILFEKLENNKIRWEA